MSTLQLAGDDICFQKTIRSDASSAHGPGLTCMRLHGPSTRPSCSTHRLLRIPASQDLLIYHIENYRDSGECRLSSRRLPTDARRARSGAWSDISSSRIRNGARTKRQQEMLVSRSFRTAIKAFQHHQNATLTTSRNRREVYVHDLCIWSIVLNNSCYRVVCYCCMQLVKHAATISCDRSNAGSRI